MNATKTKAVFNARKPASLAQRPSKFNAIQQTLPTSASIALCRIYTTIGNAARTAENVHRYARTEKGSSTSSEEHYANLPELTQEDVLQQH